ncbi:unnamed protein product [Cyclocybe aegerita]|uniref:Carboxylic ester hydrolase n=1 Tax=Cyclocybe aegerita TaxID=1973307 RepID=A0A8S0W7Z2_CYCAE|nr:unnamed protein product [Cyclocybe aegerita]
MFLSFFRLISLALLVTVHVWAAENQLQRVNNFGTNPTNVEMWVYRPNNLAANPGLIVALHYCTGTAQAYFTGTRYADLSDQYKNFLVIYPDAPDGGGCWDVHTTATLTHNAGGDSLGIASMVRYAIANYGVDPTRVFATGTSSGGMMTQVLAGAYPDLFTAASAWCGVPYGCFAGAGMWNSQCAQGQLIKTAQAWGDQVRSGYPGYTGPRPKVQIWHGTNDETLNYNNHNEAIKQWTNVFGYSTPAQTTQSNSPLNGWTRSTFGPNFQAISAQGVPHNIPVQPNDVLSWFGLLPGQSTTQPPVTTAPPVTIVPPVTTVPPPIPSTTTTATGPLQTQWSQCGGTGYTGPTVCQSPFTCNFLNNWYSQCQ